MTRVLNCKFVDIRNRTPVPLYRCLCIIEQYIYLYIILYFTLVKEGVVVQNKRFKKFIENACKGHIFILLPAIFSIGLFCYLLVSIYFAPDVCVFGCSMTRNIKHKKKHHISVLRRKIQVEKIRYSVEWFPLSVKVQLVRVDPCINILLMRIAIDML